MLIPNHVHMINCRFNRGPVRRGGQIFPTLTTNLTFTKLFYNHLQDICCGRTIAFPIPVAFVSQLVQDPANSPQQIAQKAAADPNRPRTELPSDLPEAAGTADLSHFSWQSIESLYGLSGSSRSGGTSGGGAVAAAKNNPKSPTGSVSGGTTTSSTPASGKKKGGNDPDPVAAALQVEGGKKCEKDLSEN